MCDGNASIAKYLLWIIIIPSLMSELLTVSGVTGRSALLDRDAIGRHNSGIVAGPAAIPVESSAAEWMNQSLQMPCACSSRVCYVCWGQAAAS